MPAGFYGDYPIELVNELLSSGQISLPDPQTGEPIVMISDDGRPLTAQALGALAGTSAIGNPMGNAVVDPNAAIGSLQSNYDAAQREMATGTGRYAPTPPPPNPLDERFGNDLAWLDQLFQQDPLAGIQAAQQLGTTADPESEAAQRALFGDVMSRSTTADPESAAGQRALLGDVLARGTTADPGSEAAQRDLAARIGARGTTADTRSEGTQRDVIAELLGIYQQGGLTEVDKARRAQARADVEGWLRGQREADMASLAERGLSGGGAELATLLDDRQAAATRLSAADLQTSADSEIRALQALMGGGEMATTMRGQSDQYEATNTAQLNQLLDAMRGRSDAFTMANTYVARGLLADQRNAADAYTLDNTRIAGTLLEGMRSSADAYQQNNARLISDISRTNTDYLRQAQQNMLQSRDAWDRYVLGLQTDTALGQQGFDASQNAAGWNYGYGVASDDAQRFNAAQTNANASAMGAFTGMTPGVQAATGNRIAATGGTQAAAGESASGGANFVGNLIGSLYGGGGGGGGGGGDDDDDTPDYTYKG
jgi:hypothetical protein